MSKLLYQIYHGNLSFSAIEEDALEEVIDKCYFPLLQLSSKNNLKIGLELSGYSLEKIKELRPQWIDDFKKLNEKGLVELIGSGYIQIIGPLVPYEINMQNQIIGLEAYKNILGITPELVYVNEQVFSKSMVDIYNEVGYKGIVMEWNNAYSMHTNNWNKDYSFQPVFVKGLNISLPILWTDTMLFQQFQRAVHKEMSIQEYLSSIEHYLKIGYKALAIYSSDLEVFNFRPGRFETEAIINTDEWKSISEIVKQLKKLGEFQLPSKVIEKILDVNVELDLVTTSSPILVKKQSKYSLSRWSACGRGANYINTLCYNCFNNMQDSRYIKKLLLYWGSDYRTHTTINKWCKSIKFLKNHVKVKSAGYEEIQNDVVLIEKDNNLIFEKNNYKLIFNKTKGLTLGRAYNKDKELQFGTVKHGELDYIMHGADFFTGTTIVESATTQKVTDLVHVNEYRFNKIDKNRYLLSTVIYMKDIAIEEKNWIIDVKEKTITIDLKLTTNNFINGSIRLGTLTLLAQEKNSNFWYECKNGGNKYERFYIENRVSIEHNKAISLLQSSSGGIGVTDNILRFGIKDDIICEVDIDKTCSYPFVMLQNSYDHDKYLTRVFFSVQELDDTLKVSDNREYRLKYTINGTSMCDNTRYENDENKI